MDNLETIKNISLLITSVVISIIGLLAFIIACFINRKISKINNEIEDWQVKFNEEEINGIKGMSNVDVDFDGTERKNKKIIEQRIKSLKRRKNNLLEKISIYKIFKK